jgi:hypothetical protein
MDVNLTAAHPNLQHSIIYSTVKQIWTNSEHRKTESSNQFNQIIMFQEIKKGQPSVRSSRLHITDAHWVSVSRDKCSKFYGCTLLSSVAQYYHLMVSDIAS